MEEEGYPRILDHFLWGIEESTMTAATFAEWYCEDAGLPSDVFREDICASLERQLAHFQSIIDSVSIALQSQSQPQFNDDDDDNSQRAPPPPISKSIVIKLDIRFDDVKLKDKFEWTLSFERLDAPVLQFAQTICSDLNLKTQFVPRVAHALYEEIWKQMAKWSQQMAPSSVSHQQQQQAKNKKRRRQEEEEEEEEEEGNREDEKVEITEGDNEDSNIKDNDHGTIKDKEDSNREGDKEGSNREDKEDGDRKEDKKEGNRKDERGGDQQQEEEQKQQQQGDEIADNVGEQLLQSGQREEVDDTTGEQMKKRRIKGARESGEVDSIEKSTSGDTEQLLQQEKLDVAARVASEMLREEEDWEEWTPKLIKLTDDELEKLAKREEREARYRRRHGGV